jgi:crotonobetainyl-CoA:carnitine CoA-transferase CaiB-like acyl-CoA transferase
VCHPDARVFVEHDDVLRGQRAERGRVFDVRRRAGAREALEDPPPQGQLALGHAANPKVSAMALPTGPLAGLRMLDLTRLLPGAYATGLLGDLGAEVIKVEQPGTGDPMRAMGPRLHGTSAFSWVTDRNKRSIALNLRDARGVDAFLRLAERADAVLEGFRPGVADRLGVGYEAVRAVNPRLVYCSISGYGADGPLVREAGHDVNYLGRAGVLSVSGAIPGVQVADLAGGALMALTGLLAALLHAARTGEGDHVDVSMTDGSFSLLAMSLGAYFADGRVPGAGTELLNGGVPCYGVYECADGRALTVGALERPFWEALCDGVGRLDLIDTQFDPDARETWRRLWRTRARDEWLARLAGRDACVGPVNDLAEAVRDPQLVHRGMVRDDQVGTPLRLRERPPSLRTPAPALGESTRALLAEVGLDADVLIAAGVAQ